MKKQLFILYIFFFGLCTSLQAQVYDEAYKEKFNQVRFNLGGGKTGEAFLLLQDLYKIDSMNHYTNYLIGICYTEQNIVTPLSYKHLKYASENVMDVYTYIPYTEKRSPVYVWYYLTKAYSQNGMCKEAKETMDKFMEHYGSEKNDYFVVNIRKFLLQCKNEAYKLKKRGYKNVITKEVTYTTESSLYGIQVGAFKELIPVKEEFDNLKNVEAFMDKEGMIRYIVGHFSFKKQAESLLDVIKKAGYNDAFIVDVNKESRFSREVIIVDNMSFKANLRGKIDYRVQIGAFSNKDSIPEDLARLYIKVDQINEVIEGDLTLVTAGSYSNYDNAAKYKDELLQLGIPGAFVIAINQGHKVSLRAAEKYLENNKSQAEENSKKKR